MYKRQLAQRVVDVDVGGAVSGVGAAQTVRQYVEPGVHPAAPREGLEAQPVAVARDDRVERGAQGAPVVAGRGHVRDGEQGPRSRLRGAQEPGEELGMGVGPGRGQTPRRLQVEGLTRPGGGQ